MTSGIQNEDLCLDTSTWNLYQYQTNSWVLIGNIKGATGQQGIQGIQGPAGTYIKATKTSVSGNTVSLTMNQSTYYELTGTAITQINLTTGSVEANTVGEFMCEFTITTGHSRPTITLKNSNNDTIPYANNWANTEFIAGYKYILYILNNICYVSFVGV